jgi:hypothetical protein
MTGIIYLILFFIIVTACCALGDDKSSGNTSSRKTTTVKRNTYSSNTRSYNDDYCECPSCGAPYYDGYCEECGYPDINQGWIGENY